MSAPLPPCPYCKGEADVYRKIHPIEHDWSVCCKTCWAGTAEYPTEAEARAAWARRDELDTLAAQVRSAVDEASRQADRAIAAEAEAARLREAIIGAERRGMWTCRCDGAGTDKYTCYFHRVLQGKP